MDSSFIICNYHWQGGRAGSGKLQRLSRNEKMTSCPWHAHHTTAINFSLTLSCKKSEIQLDPISDMSRPRHSLKSIKKSKVSFLEIEKGEHRNSLTSAANAFSPFSQSGFGIDNPLGRIKSLAAVERYLFLVYWEEEKKMRGDFLFFFSVNLLINTKTEV